MTEALPFDEAQVNAAYEAAMQAVAHQLDTMHDPHATQAPKRAIAAGRDILLRGDMNGFIEEARFYQQELARYPEHPREPGFVITWAGLTHMARALGITIPKHPWSKAQIDAAYDQALLEIAPNLSRIRHPHLINTVKGTLAGGKAFLEAQGIAGFMRKLARVHDNLAKYPGDEATPIELLGMRSMARQLGITIDQADLNRALETVAAEHTIELSRNAQRFDLSCDVEALIQSRNASGHEYSTRDFHHYLQAHPGEFHLNYDDKYNNPYFGHMKYLGEIQRDVCERLYAFHPQEHNIVSYLEEKLAHAKEILRPSAEALHVTEDVAAIEAYADLWLASIKKEIGVQNPAQVRAAMHKAIEEVVMPAKAGRQIAVGLRADPQQAFRLALHLQKRAENFQERHDIARFFNEDDEYTHTTGATRHLANETLRHFFREMKLPCPALSEGMIGRGVGVAI